MNNPSSTGYVLSRINTIPVTGLTQSIYLTNDVRPGRSQLVLYLVNSVNPLSLIYAGVDISQTEVAARLGSIDTFSRSGQVLWMDNFENGLMGWVLLGSTGAIGCLSTDFPQSGQVSAKLIAPAGGGYYALIQKSDVYGSLCRMGAEANFLMPVSDSGIGQFDLILDIYTGSKMYKAQLRYDNSANVIQYLNSANTLVTLATGVTLQYGVYHRMKFVIDSSSMTYARLLLDNYIFNLPGTALYGSASGTNPQVVVQCQVTATNSTPVTAGMANAIFTLNEP